MLLSGIFLKAQNTAPNEFCGTKPGKSEWLKKYQAGKLHAADRGSEKLYVPLTVTIVTNDDGSKSYSLNNVFDELCQLNRDYDASGIYFYLNTPVRWIANTAWNNHKDYGTAFDMFQNNVEKTVNVYYCSDAAGNCGYDIMGVGMVLSKGCMGPLSHTWAHEMGHELSLPHTFAGWEGAKYDATAVPDTINGYQVELVSRSNCNTASDGFCDTPPDYLNYRWDCQADGKSATQLKDPQGQGFRVDGSFFMSYSKFDCMTRFSAEQIAAMRTNCLTDKGSFVTKNFNITTLKDSVRVLIPLNGSLLKPDNAVLSWIKNDDYTHYYYEVARDKNFNYLVQSKLTTDTFALLNPLLVSKDYFWRISGFNLSSACQPQKTARFFKFTTDNSFSNVVDVNFLAAVKVFPNPLGSEGLLRVALQAQRSGKIALSLHHMNGSVISRKDFQISDGENELTIQHENLSAGMYLLRIDAATGSIQRKIVVF